MHGERKDAALPRLRRYNLGYQTLKLAANSDIAEASFF
jgi:hypothetical protein